MLSQASDSQRGNIADALNLVSYLALALFFALALAALLSYFFLRQARRRAIDQNLIASRLSAMVSSSLDGVIAMNAAGVVIEFNGAAESMFGYSADEAIGSKLDDLIVPDHLKDAHRAGMERYLTTGEKHVIGKGRVQLEARRKNGDIFPVELSIASSESEEGEIFVSFLRDISRRVAAEQELIKARDNAVAGEKAKADLIAVMSHEMRTPLNGMLGTLELFDMEKHSPKDREYLEIIRASGKLLLHHVDNVLEISRAEAGKIEIARTIFSVPALVRELIESQRGVAEHRGNTLSVRIDLQGGDYAVGDPIRIRQVLLNLIGNAIKFTRNGYITVEASRQSQADFIEFRVKDTGIGIAAKDHERIFDDFVTLDASFSRAVGGTGLGLAIVRRLVTAMGGTIKLDSSSGRGSTFRILLPLPVASDNAAASGKADAPGRTAVGYQPIARMKILLVEDNRINRIVARDLLEKDGHEVHEALDGQQGMEMARKNSFDLVLMDISMPVMDGIEATRAIRSAEVAGTHLPIVALTANAIPSERDRFLAAGLDDILVKPITLTGLRELLRHYSPGLEEDGRSDDDEAPVFDAMVDHGHLEELGSALGATRINDLVRAFLVEAEAAIETISARIEKGEIDAALRETVHHTAGSAALLGAEKLRAELAQLELHIAESLPIGTAESRTLQRVWSKTDPELRIHLTKADD
ncbi:MAG: ATP-binding protein [Chromatiales bacterium]